MQRSGERRRAGSGIGLFAAIFAVTFCLCAVWSVAMPLLSGPDEPTHVVRAAGLVRGQFVGSCGDTPQNPGGTCPKSSPFTEVHVPAFYSLLRNGGNIPGTKIAHHGVQCYARRVDTPASCVIYTSPSKYAGLSENAWIYDGRYPPLYYAIVGLPTLLGSGLWALYLMRLVSAAASALFLAIAVFVVLRYGRGRLLLLGLVVAATPMVLYLGAVVNANGLEASSAVAFWTAGIVMARECDGAPPRALVVLTFASATVFESVRALSLFWLFVSALAIVATARWRDLRAIFARRDVQVACALLGAVGAADLVWFLYEHATALNVSSQNARALVPPPGTSELSILATSFHHNVYYVPGMVGVFGAFDTYAPQLTFVVWYALVALLLAVGVLSGSVRTGVVLVAVALGVVVIPVLISSSQARQIGFVWSGRDTLPFAVGLPILSAALADGRRFAPALGRLAPLCLLAAAAAQFAAMFVALRRYAVGAAGAAYGFVLHPSWSPPVLGCLGVLVAEALVLACSSGLVAGSLRLDPARGQRARRKRPAVPAGVVGEP